MAKEGEWEKPTASDCTGGGEGLKKLSGSCQVRDSPPSKPCFIRGMAKGAPALGPTCPPAKQKPERYRKQKAQALNFPYLFRLCSLCTRTFHQALCLPLSMECVPSFNWKNDSVSGKEKRTTW